MISSDEGLYEGMTHVGCHRLVVEKSSYLGLGDWFIDLVSLNR